MQQTAAKTSKIINLFIKELGKPKQKNITAAVTALIKQEKPTLYKLNLHKQRKKPIQKLSFEQNSRRMLNKIGIIPEVFARAIIATFNITHFELVMDRTNWKYGNCAYNLLVLSVIWNNISIPIYWISLDNKGGNSDSSQRIALIDWFVSTFGTQNITHIFADREFPSEQFFDYLQKHSIKFIFRTKSSILVTENDKKVKLNTIFSKLHNMPNQTKCEHHIRRAYGNRLYLSARLNNKNEKVYLISNNYDTDAFDLYRHRWTIEAMFAKFKTKGLNLESTHLMKQQRVHNLIYLMTIAYSIFCKLGFIANKIKNIKLKKIKETNKYRYTSEFSLFNLGFNLLKNLFDNFLCDSAVVTRQLYHILNYPPEINVPKRLRIYNIISNF
jgi:hypothetical protein